MVIQPDATIEPDAARPVDADGDGTQTAVTTASMLQTQSKPTATMMGWGMPRR